LIIIFAIWLLAVSVIVFVLGWLIQFLNNFHSQNNLDHKQNRPKNNDE
jgi:heme/copper-type cytochrome/quinol oxidase subunit 2